MAKVTVGNIKEATKVTELYNLANAIRNSSLQHYKDYIPLASADNIQEFWASVMNLQVQNDFINALVNRIGLTIIKHVSLSNPLAKFKSGKNALGDTIQEIFVDLTKAHQYDAEVAETEVYKREIPNVHVLYHKLNRKEFYKQTIQEADLQQAFTSWDKFGSFVAKIVQTLVNSNEVDEYKYMKMLFDVAHSKGWFTEVKVQNQGTSETQMKDLVKKARAAFTKITLPQGTRAFNSLNVHTKSDESDVYLFVTAETWADMNVDVMASAFNMDKASFLGQVMVVESLPPNVKAIMIDSSFFVVHDTIYQMKTKENEQGLYWNYWLHVWQTISATRFANAVAFVGEVTRPITQVVVYPTIKALKEAVVFDFDYIVKTVQNATIPAYTVSASFIDEETMLPTSTGIMATVDTANKIVKVSLGANAPERIIMRVTASYQVGVDGENDPVYDTVVGSSYIQKI